MFIQITLLFTFPVFGMQMPEEAMQLMLNSNITNGRFHGTAYICIMYSEIDKTTCWFKQTTNSLIQKLKEGYCASILGINTLQSDKQIVRGIKWGKKLQ